MFLERAFCDCLPFELLSSNFLWEEWFLKQMSTVLSAASWIDGAVRLEHRPRMFEVHTVRVRGGGAAGRVQECRKEQVESARKPEEGGVRGNQKRRGGGNREGWMRGKHGGEIVLTWRVSPPSVDEKRN